MSKFLFELFLIVLAFLHFSGLTPLLPANQAHFLRLLDSADEGLSPGAVTGGPVCFGGNTSAGIVLGALALVGKLGCKLLPGCAGAKTPD